MKIKMNKRAYGSNTGIHVSKFNEDEEYEVHDGPEFNEGQISRSLATVWLGIKQCTRVEEKAEKAAPSNKAKKKAPENK